MIKVIKRDGRLKDYDEKRIEVAVEKALKDIGDGDKGIGKLVAALVSYNLSTNKVEEIDIEKLQDIVIESMKGFSAEGANSYSEYRDLRNIRRKTLLDDEITGIKNGTSEEVRNNANKDGKKLQTYRAMMADITCIDYAKRKIVPKHIIEHHGKDIYIHDFNYLDVPMYNCCLINWEDCLENGMVIGNAPIEKPKSITTAINLLSQIVAHVSSNCYGGVTLINTTKGLSQYGLASLNKHRKDSELWVEEPLRERYSWAMLEKEIKNATQGLEYEIQTLTNSRAEIPFVTMELDTIDLEASEEEQRIQHLIITNILNTRIKGLSGGVTPVFPKLVFELKRGNNLEKEDKYYDVYKLAVKCSSLRLYPDYLMHDKLVEVTGSYKAPMSCRSFVPKLVYEDKEVIGGAFNQGVCSVNLPRLAIQSKGDEKVFYELLDKSLNLAKESLMLRHEALKNVKAKQAPILYQYGAIARLDPEQTIERLLGKDRSTISIGYVGLHNALMALYGESYETKLDKGIKILEHLRRRCDEFKAETNVGFSLYSTPAEALATKFCRTDVKDFGVVEGVNDRGYYENSFHYPSFLDISPFDKIDLEAKMSHVPSGGAIQYNEFPSMIHNKEALEAIITYAYDKCHYFGVNVSSDRCLECGFVGEMISLDSENSKYECPQCGNRDNGTLSVIKRLCGYLGSLSERPTVDGKMREINSRVEHYKE